YCVLISDQESAAERLQFMAKNSDGFRIAEKDLELRGPGDLIGKRQHGLPEFEIADLERDMNVFYDTLAAAKQTFESDPQLKKPENAPLRDWIKRMFSRTP
ncbi:MAG: ATP-dependent DNA helicase RecG, partial [Clostridia bacterium]|nr:ATP-dependent DNA helicase RecG [Clostridia bacterium]